MSPQTAKLAPPPADPNDPALFRPLVNRLLSEEFGLQPLSAFSIVVEGITDRDYILRAAEVARERLKFDLLGIPDELRDSGPNRIGVCCPGGPIANRRGGTSRLTYLSKLLKPFYRMGLFRGVVFVLDHDETGIESSREIRKTGFEAITLDPREHPSIRGDGAVFVEDLLSLDVQSRFFRQGDATCDHQFEHGDLVRIRWRHHSKPKLCEYACKEGSMEAFGELCALLRRIRAVWGLPVPNFTVQPAIGMASGGTEQQ